MTDTSFNSSPSDAKPITADAVQAIILLRRLAINTSEHVKFILADHDPAILLEKIIYPLEDGGVDPLVANHVHSILCMFDELDHVIGKIAMLTNSLEHDVESWHGLACSSSDGDERLDLTISIDPRK